MSNSSCRWAANEIVIDRPKGTTHPRYSEVVYPVDYGYLKGTSSTDGNEIDVWRGSMTASQLVGVVCTVDTLKGDAEVKLLVGCTDDEIEAVDKFHNENDYMSGIVVIRGRDSRQPAGPVDDEDTVPE